MGPLLKQKIDGLENVGNIEVPYALTGIRHGTIRIKLKHDSIPTVSNGAIPAFVNVQLIAALDSNGVVHLYTIANFPLSKLKSNTKVGKPKKSKKVKAKSKTVVEKGSDDHNFVSAWSNMKESMTFSLEHDNVVDFTIDTSDSHRIILVSVGSDGSVHTAVLGLQVFNGKEFIGQVLPVAVSKRSRNSNSKEAVATVSTSVNSGTAKEVEVDVDGNERNVADKVAPVMETPSTPASPNGRSESSVLMSMLDAQYEHFRAYLTTKYGHSKSNYRHSINAYGDNDRNFNKDRPSPTHVAEQENSEAPAPLELYVSLAGFVTEKHNVLRGVASGSGCLPHHLTPSSLMVMPASAPLGLTKRERAILAGSLSSHTYVIGLHCNLESEKGILPIPALIYTQPNGTIIHTLYNEVSTPNTMVDMTPVHGLDILLGITKFNELYLVSTKNKKLVKHNDQRTSADESSKTSVAVDFEYDSWYLDADDCIDLSIESAMSEDGYSHMPNDEYKQILAVKPHPKLAKDTVHEESGDETAVTLTIQMKSGLVNVYTLRSFSMSENHTYAEELSNITDSDRVYRPTKKGFRCFYAGTIDPPFPDIPHIPVEKKSNEYRFRDSRMVLLNHPNNGLVRRNTAPNHPVHSNVLVASSDHCGLGLYNISLPDSFKNIGLNINSGGEVPARLELSDDILMFRRNYAKNCLLPEHAATLNLGSNLGLKMITGVEIYSHSHLTSSSGTSGVIAQPPSIAAPKKGRSGALIMGNVANKKKAASINQRRKGGGIASANSETKTNNELFQAELPVHYNNLAVGYNSFNITPSGDGAVHGHILFYDQMTSVQYTPPADDVWTTLAKYGVLLAALLLAAIYKFVFKGSGKHGSKKKGIFGQKKTGYGQASAALHNKFGTKHSPNQHQRFLGSDTEDEEDDDVRAMEEKKSVNKLMERATALQKMIDEAEYAANVAKNKNSYNNGNKNSHGMGLPNSSRANKLRRDRYDEPDRFTDFD